MQEQEMQTADNDKSIEKHKHNYQKYLNNVYESIKQKQYSLKKSTYSDVPASLPKLHPKDFLIDCFDLTEKTDRSIKIKNQGTNSSHRCKVFKSFINRLNEEQRKLNSNNMNLLGLEIKKMGYSQKTRLKNDYVEEFFDDTNKHIDNQFQLAIGKSKNNATLELDQRNNHVDLLCRKIDIYKRQIHSMNKHSIRKNVCKIRQKPLTSVPKNERTQKLEKDKKIAKIVNAEYINPIYEGRFQSYRQLVFKINYAHNVYVDFIKYDFDQTQIFLRNDQKYKAYIGQGNNNILIKNLIKRRFWWAIVEEKTLEVNFLWTQLKVNDYFNKQQKILINTNSQQHLQRETSSNLQICKSSQGPIRKKKQLKQQLMVDENYFYKVFNDKDAEKYRKKLQKHENKIYSQKRQILSLKIYNNNNSKMHNHLINNFYLGNKKALFYNLKQYYQLNHQNPFKKIPLTFHIKKGFKDIQYKRFIAYFKKRYNFIKQQEKDIQQNCMPKKKMRNVWIVKPGQLTNRGNGITVIDQIYQLNSIIKRQDKHSNGSEKTFIVQLYLDQPFLYQKRKFDIRHYILITHLYGIMRGYWFTQGYIRTSSYQFDIQNFDREIHLTNDAVQKYTPYYGRYQFGNKLSYLDFQRYLDAKYPKKKYNFNESILPKMKQISLDAIKSAYLKLSPQKLQHNFQIFGLDFMIDSQFKPWLIQINTNPCLELASPLLSRLIPQMVDQAFRLSLDVVYPPPCHYPNTAKHLVPEAGLENLKFELIFDQKIDGNNIRNLYKKIKGNLLDDIGQISEDEIYQDNGKDIKLDQVLEL